MKRRFALLALCVTVVLQIGCGKDPEEAAQAPAASPPAPQGVPVAAAPTQPAGNVEAGASIANQGVPAAGVAPCVTCHGANGAGNAAAGFPRLSGQWAAYLAHQLDAYAEGNRPHPIMTPIAKGLTPEQRRDTAAHYARLTAPATEAAPPSDPRGRTLANQGDDSLRVQACNNCHGPDGAGLPPVYPYLAGQHASYLLATLQAWKNGSRDTDPSGQMPTIASQLSEADMQAVARYYAALPPPAGEQRMQQPRGQNSATTQTGPRGDAKDPQGIGTEAGTGTISGEVGPGGGGASGKADATVDDDKKERQTE